jgi:hypothetical protein
MDVNEIISYDNVNQPSEFFIKVSAAVLGGLCLGSLIDSTCRTFQKGAFDWRQRDFSSSILYFIIQIAINICILLFLARLFPIRFVEWLQLTISGSLFGTLLFATQQNLVNNALRIFYVHVDGEVPNASEPAFDATLQKWH